MRYVAAAIVFAVTSMLVVGPGAPTETHEDALQLVRVAVSGPRQAFRVAASFDETHNRVPGHVEVLLWPGDAARLASLGLDYEVVEDDVYGRDLELFRGPQPRVAVPGPDRSEYRRLDDYVSEMQRLARRNPRLVRLLRLRSETLEGRAVYGVEIAAGGSGRDGRPAFYVDGIHHAREWPAGEYSMMFAHRLVRRFGKDSSVTRLLRLVRVIVVPVVNPDGFDYSRESPLSLNQDVSDATFPTAAGNGHEGYWRKNRRSLTGITLPVLQTNPDAYGVDPNRNYSWHWGDDIGGSSSTQADQTYRGESPRSEPETANVATLLAARNVTAVVSNHTYGRLVLRPWGDTQRDAPDERLLRRLGAAMASAMGGYDNIKGIGLYATTGTTSDWSYGTLGALSYTFEHDGAFHPPYRAVARSASGVMRAFMIGARAAATPRWHSMITGRVVDSSGRPVRTRLRLSKTVRTPLWPGNPSGERYFSERLNMTTTTAADGTFRWHVNPSTRPHVAARGGSEAYRFVVGDRRFRIVVKRGRVAALGTIVI